MQEPTPSRRRWPRRLLITLGILVALVVAIRLALDPLASHATRKALNEAEGISGDFSSVHVNVLPPSYEVENLKIIEAEGGDWQRPLLYAKQVLLVLDWRRLLHAELSADVRLDQPKIIVTQPEKPSKTKIPDIQTALRQALPARVNRIEVKNGEFLFRDPSRPRTPELWLHGISLVAENLATRKKLAEGRRATVEMSGTLGRSGALTVSASADPFMAKPEFSGKMALRGWRVTELYDLIEPTTDLQTSGGTLGLFAVFEAKGGEIEGSVKPVLHDVTVRPTEEGWGNRLKAWIADKGLDMFSREHDDKSETVATVVPIRGRLDKPDIQLWPTILGVIRNAFVEGVSAGFANLPPPEAPHKEGVLKQMKDALQKDKGPPKAQPQEDSKEEKK